MCKQQNQRIYSMNLHAVVVYLKYASYHQYKEKGKQTEKEEIAKWITN